MLFRTLRFHLSRWLWRSANQPCSSSKKTTDYLPPDPRPVKTMPTTLFFYPYKTRSFDTTDSGLGSSRPPTICTPDSSRSVYFNDSIDWPFIDDEVDPCI